MKAAGRLVAAGRLLAVAGCFGACASEAPRTDFDAGAGTATVVVGDDGFVTLDGQRMPLERAVLELRLRTRALPPGDLLRFVVELWVEPTSSPEVGARIGDGRNRFLDQLYIMGVRQVRL